MKDKDGSEGIEQEKSRNAGPRAKGPQTGQSHQKAREQAQGQWAWHWSRVALGSSEPQDSLRAECREAAPDTGMHCGGSKQALKCTKDQVGRWVDMEVK